MPTVETANKGVKRVVDVLTFAGGKVSSKELQRYGIGPVAYRATGTKDFANWGNRAGSETERKGAVGRRDQRAGHQGQPEVGHQKRRDALLFY
ncbi:MAG: hypothetical protein ACR2MW_05200 [Chthoniobacterales bacterium]